MCSLCVQQCVQHCPMASLHNIERNPFIELPAILQLTTETSNKSDQALSFVLPYVSRQAGLPGESQSVLLLSRVALQGKSIIRDTTVQHTSTQL